jgi:LysM repeat protein
VHQDQRIGLAMAVLLLGAAGAFFFRNEPKPAGSSPRLKSARILDAKIAEKPIAPYLQDNDADHEPRSVAGKAPDRTKPDSDAGNHRSLPQLDAPDFLGPEERLANGDKAGSARDSIQDLSPIPFSNTNDGNSGSSAGIHDRTAKSPGAADRVQTDRVHVVQKGETLSSIAAKELGSAARFQDVFEANRDQLENANDVRVGMSLRIPVPRVARNDDSRPASTGRTKDRPGTPVSPQPPLSPANPAGGAVEEMPPIGVEPGKPLPDSSGESSPTKKKFEPANRPPSGVKGFGTETGDAESPSKPVRRLTQLPPKDADGKVAR